ncbi:hypothetical protein HF086_004362 [Spodoptera exigua]|uniref:G-protein coupled receptors family 2 profile 2 domain-containing protein n=1 Tax=Spodoptera exigua TaxID=7107 RepID=A0A922SBN4_SPOEX|nr:hypothetical protein HF086_004362 [Spodoptera exigua]
MLYILNDVIKLLHFQEIVFFVLVGCSLTLAVTPCCPNGEMLIPKGFCGTEKMTAINCTNGRIVLRDIILDGTKVSTQDSPGFVFVEDPNQYCVADMYKNNSEHSLGTVKVAIVCFEKISKTSDIETSGILTLISVFFLVATNAVYTFLPQLRDLQGLCYMCMCISMALGFLSLGILQLSPGFRGEICTVTVKKISTVVKLSDSSYLKKTEKKQYFLYSCYAWGCTLLFLTVTLIANFVEGEHYKPGFGNGSCWFSGRTETWIFFYGPIAVLITANVVLFAMTSFNLWRQTRKYEVNTLNVLKHKFLLSLKLFLVMGISWIFEIASFAHGSAHIIWKIMDTFNCLQGVIIFLLLVIFRRRAMRGLANENICARFSRPLAEKLSPHDDSDDQQILGDDTVEVRLN